MFGAGANPVGQQVTLWNQPFEVVGVVTSATWVVQPAPGDDQFDAVYMPYTTTQRLLNLSKLNDITVTAESSGDVSRLSREITKLLRVRHGIGDNDPDDFTIITQATKALTTGGLPPGVARAVAGNVAELEKVTLEQLALTMERASRTMTWLLAAVAAVSLLVGGIGIMNITLLSVTERTKEIGLRMAVGARGKDVMRQFLFEAVVISAARRPARHHRRRDRVDRHCAIAAVGDGGVAGVGAARVRRCRRGRRVLRLVSGADAPRSSIRSSPCAASSRRTQDPRPCSVFCMSARRSPCARSTAIDLRTALTMLGVIIGVAAVIAMVALGSGARGSVETSLKSAGTNIIQVSAGNFTRGGESMNIASGLGARDDADDRGCRRDPRHRRRAARGRRRQEPRVREVVASAVLHAGPRRRAGARRDPRLGMAWRLVRPPRPMRP